MSEVQVEVISNEIAPIVCKGATNLTLEKDVALEKWLSTHYVLEEGVFLSVIQDKAGQLVNWGFGPFRLKINVAFTGVTGEFGIQIPLIGYQKLINIDGDLISGVEAGFNIGIASGSIKLYLKGKQVMIELKASAFGASWNTTYVLLNL